jgi:hypothetical protein
MDGDAARNRIAAVRAGGGKVSIDPGCRCRPHVKPVLTFG